MKFYEDQHKLAAYLERTGAEWEVKIATGGYGPPAPQYSTKYYTKYGVCIRPVLRYGLPSHLQSEIHNPDNLTEEQICEGGEYRACVIGDKSFDDGQYWSTRLQKWDSVKNMIIEGDEYFTARLPPSVPWPDWEREGEVWDEDLKAYVATNLIDSPAQAREIIAAKDARIATLETQLLALSNSCESLRETCSKITSPWRRMSEVPTEEDFVGGDGYVLIRFESGSLQWLHQRNYRISPFSSEIVAWMPVPKFHGWPDPLADLLKSHGVEATQELTAALTAWKGVEK